MQIKFKKDFRKFKEGSYIDFDFDEHQIIVLVGKNGSGKSTIGYAIQNLIGTVKKTNYLNVGGTLQEYKDAVEITDADFNVVDTLCCVRDNPDSLSCGADATSWFEAGGYATRTASHGNKQSYVFGQMLSRNANIKKTDKKNLFVIDEIDSGLDLKMRHMMGSYGLSNIAIKNNANIIFITHCPLMIMLLELMCDAAIFDVDEMKYTTADEYIKKTCGFKLKISSE